MKTFSLFVFKPFVQGPDSVIRLKDEQRTAFWPERWGGRCLAAFSDPHMKNHLPRPQTSISPYHMLLICSLQLLAGCHSADVTRFDQTHYPRTSAVKVYSDIATVTGEYFEIGYVEAKGGITVSKQALLDDMIQQAKEAGAHALIKVEFYDRQHYDPNIGSFEKPAAKAVMIRFRSK